MLDVEAHLTWDGFEQLARPYLACTVELTAITGPARAWRDVTPAVMTGALLRRLHPGGH